MEDVPKRAEGKLSFDGTDFSEIARLPLESKTWESQGSKSIYLSAISNKLGLLFYSIENKVVVVKKKGLQELFALLKGKAKPEKEYSLKEFLDKGLATTISFPDIANQKIQGICVKPESENTLGVAFEQVAYSIPLQDLSKGEVSVQSVTNKKTGRKFTRLAYVDNSLCCLDSEGEFTVLGDLKVEVKDNKPIDFIVAKVSEKTIFATVQRQKPAAHIYELQQGKSKLIRKIELPEKNEEDEPLLPYSIMVMSNGAVVVGGLFNGECQTFVLITISSANDLYKEGSTISINKQIDPFTFDSTKYPEAPAYVQFKAVEFPEQ